MSYESLSFSADSSPMIRSVIIVLILAAAAAAAQDHSPLPDTGQRGIILGAYMDVGYLYSFTRPDPNEWRFKGTSTRLNAVAVNNATVALFKPTSDTSRFGFMIGLQAGDDVENQIPEEGGFKGKNWLGHLYYSGVAYRLPVGNGLEVMAGILPGLSGYPHFHAINNINYTRPYAVDYVPYFHLGAQVKYPFSDAVDVTLMVANGYDYLNAGNGAVSAAARGGWKVADNLKLTQSFYYGPDQQNTSPAYWRFLSNTIAEWTPGRWTLVASLHIGSETVEQEVYDLPGFTSMDLHGSWFALTMWVRYAITDEWSIAARPEVYDDPNGLRTGSMQTIRAFTLTGEFRKEILPGLLLSAKLEGRYDHTTGARGFYTNELSTNPRQLLLGGGLAMRYVLGL